MRVDPAADRLRIDFPQRLRAHAAGDRAAVFIRHPCGVEAEAGARCGADAAARDDPKNEGAGGEAVSVDHDPLARGADSCEGLQIAANLPTAVFRDAHVGMRGGHRGHKNSGAQHQAPNLH